MGNKTYITKWTPNLDAIQRMAHDGFSYTEIGEVFGVKGHVIRNLLNRRGLYVTRKDVAKSKWQPIKTAPMNNTLILLCYLDDEDYLVNTGYWATYYHLEERLQEDPHWEWPNYGYQPTHWMDLPQPPKE